MLLAFFDCPSMLKYFWVIHNVPWSLIFCCPELLLLCWFPTTVSVHPTCCFLSWGPCVLLCLRPDPSLLPYTGSLRVSTYNRLLCSFTKLALLLCTRYGWIRPYELFNNQFIQTPIRLFTRLCPSRIVLTRCFTLLFTPPYHISGGWTGLLMCAGVLPVSPRSAQGAMRYRTAVRRLVLGRQRRNTYDYAATGR